MTIKTFDPASCRVLGKQIETALAEFAKRNGITIEYRGGTYDGSGGNFTAKFECSVINADGSVQSREAEAFKVFAPSYGLKPEDLGRTFPFRGQSYALCGIKPGSPKAPILAKRADGKVFKFTPDLARMLLAAGASSVTQ